MTFIVGHNNKCHIYRSVGGCAIYILQFVNIQAYLYNHKKNINIIKIYIYYVPQQKNVIFIVQKLLHLTKKKLILKVSIFWDKFFKHNI